MTATNNMSISATETSESGITQFYQTYMKPASEFFERSTINFDALAEFRQLTASVRPQPEDEKEETIEDEPAEIIDRYDRSGRLRTRKG
jgi:hypothetical protein